MMGRISSIFRRNLPAKIIAFIIAAGIWLFVMNEQNPSIDGSFSVPIAVENEPEGYQISYMENSVKLNVRGPRSLFVSAKEQDFKAYIDLNGVDAGRHNVKVKVVLPQGFELLSVSPDTVEVDMDPIVQKKVHADIIVMGSPAPGSTVAGVEQSIENVVIEGPASLINDVARVIGYVGVTGNDSDFTLDVPLSAVDRDGKAVHGVKVEPSSLTAEVSLARGLTKKGVVVKPVFSGNLPAGYLVGNVRIDPSKIEIAGEASILKNIDSINTKSIDLSKITKNTKGVYELALPHGITVTNRNVTVSIEVRTDNK